MWFVDGGRVAEKVDVIADKGVRTLQLESFALSRCNDKLSMITN